MIIDRIYIGRMLVGRMCIMGRYVAGISRECCLFGCNGMLLIGCVLAEYALAECWLVECVLWADMLQEFQENVVCLVVKECC